MRAAGEEGGARGKPGRMRRDRADFPLSERLRCRYNAYWT